MSVANTTQVYTGKAGSGDGNDTSGVHRHRTLTDWVLIQINGDLGGGTIQPYIDATVGVASNDMEKEVPLTGTTYTDEGAWQLKCPPGARLRLKMTGSTNPDYEAIIQSPDIHN